MDQYWGTNVRRWLKTSRNVRYVEDNVDAIIELVKLNQVQERIVELFSNFVTQVRRETAMNRFDINRISEVVAE